MSRSRNVRVDPAKRVTKAVYKKTLSKVNALRKLGKLKPLAKMPLGIPGEGSSCPIFYALAPLGVTEVRGEELVVELTNPLAPESSTTETVFSAEIIDGGEVFEQFVEQFDNDVLGTGGSSW